MPDRRAAADDTLAWLESAVVGLNLCPFAAPVLSHGLLDIVVSDAGEPNRLVADLDAALRRLNGQPANELETTLLVVTDMLQRFDDFNDFLDVADALLDARGLVGTIQIASFHPDYVFDGVADDDPGNWTNRAPWPTLHLLREQSVAEAAEQHPDVSAIPQQNRLRLQQLDDTRRRSIFGRSRSTNTARS